MVDRLRRPTPLVSQRRRLCGGEISLGLARIDYLSRHHARKYV